MSTVAERLAALRAQVEAATDLPWDATGWVYGGVSTESYGVWSGPPDGDHGVPLAKTSRLQRGWEDAILLVLAVNALPAVLTHIENVLGRHKAYEHILTRVVRCDACNDVWPCPDAAAALTLLGQLDGGTND